MQGIYRYGVVFGQRVSVNKRVKKNVPRKKLTRTDVGSYRGPYSKALTLYQGPTGVSKGVSLGSGVYAVRSLDKPLETSWLGECQALVIINRQANQHYMAHIPFIEIPPKRLAEHLQRVIPLRGSQIIIVPGSNPRTQHTSDAILKALHYIDPALLEQVEFRHTPIRWTASVLPSVVSYQGDVYYTSYHPDELPLFYSGGRDMHHLVDRTHMNAVLGL